VRNFLIMLLVFNSVSAYAINEEFDCQQVVPNSKTVYTLTISAYFGRGAEFRLCKVGSSSEDVLLSGDPRNRSDFSPRQIKLNSAQSIELEKLFEEALDYNLRYKESFSVLDGSTWCLEYERSGMSSENCFWSPYDEQHSRGLIGLIKLGEKLWQVADGDKRYGKLR
jgi:hypothetical protein